MELVVLVVGILAAFSLDAWWDTREETAREQELLTELLGELTEGRRRVSNASTAHDGAAARLCGLLAQLGSVPLDARVQVPDTLLTQLAAFNTLEIASGVLGSTPFARTVELRHWPCDPVAEGVEFALDTRVVEALDVGEDVGGRDTAQGVYDDAGNDPRLLCHDGRRERESEEEEPADAVKPGTMRKPVSPAKFQAMSPHES